MSVPVAQRSSGDRLGRYRVLVVLAQGGMGNVYLAAAEGMEGVRKLLVIKELRSEQAEDEVHVTMFLDEARLAVRLNHPNIVQTIDVGSDGARRFLVMEHLDGQPLHRVLRRTRREGQPLSLDLYVRVLIDVLDALSYSHDLTEFDGTPLGIVHRDVSHQNVFLTYEGQVKLIDFGIAKTLLASQQTNTGVLKGKIRYMAPEQATGHAVDGRTDVFSVGVMLWDALVGHGPWEGQNDVQILRCLVTGAVPRLGDQPHSLPADLVAVVDRAMSHDIEDRYPTASLMRDDLLRCLAPAPRAGQARALREVVSRLFANERRELGALANARLRGTNTDGSLPLVSLTRVRTPTHGASSTPSRRVEPSSDGPSVFEPGPAQAIRVVSASLGPGAASRHRLAAALAAALLATVVGILLLRQPHASPGAVTVTPTVAAPPAPPPPPPPPVAPRTVHLSVRASPPTARVFVDGILVDSPYAAQLAPDDTVHSLRAEAPGHISQTRAFTVATDVDLAISLDREPVHWRGVPEPARSPVRSAPPTASISTQSPPVSPAEVRVQRVRSQRDLDKENPYAQ